MQTATNDNFFMPSLATYDFNVRPSGWKHRRVEDLVDVHNKVLELVVSQSIFIFICSMCSQYFLYLLPSDLTIEHQIKKDLGSFPFAGTANRDLINIKQVLLT
jgi:hypothetical protein